MTKLTGSPSIIDPDETSKAVREEQGAPTPWQDGTQEKSFAEVALELGGKSAEEARRTGAIDTADDQVESLFAPQYQTVNSPAHRAVWDRGVPVGEFESTQVKIAPEIHAAMDNAIDVVKRHRDAGTTYNDEGKITDQVMQDLADVGYWGLLVDKQYGGSGAPFAAFASFITRMATVDPTIAGLASVHGCIGAVDPVSAFGNDEQKERFLPKLASGERLSAFALTEPCAGSDLTALRTEAVLDGDHYLVTGEKLFITNVKLGRTVGLVCLIDGKPSVLVVDLPQEESEQFRLKDYGLWALKHTYNRGMVFNKFPVPVENLLKPIKGDGLTIAYHGLNLGRVSLCANAAGTMRAMLANMIPWSQYRVTYHQPIAKRELVQRRMGELSGLIVACDALVAWCAELIDKGYRGEMECVVAKIFGSEAQKHAAIELFMKTHGGRSFLHGHLFGDNVHEFLAPCIYEGEGEMLAMAFFKSLVKHHGKKYFEPVGKALAAAGIKKPNPLNPAHIMKLAPVAWPYAKWVIGRRLMFTAAPALPKMPAALRRHADYACQGLQKMALEISSTMSKFQLALADRQCRMEDLSSRCQTLITVLATTLYASRQTNEVLHEAADVFCQNQIAKLEGERATNSYYRQITELGDVIADGGFPGLEEIDAYEIMMPYEKEEPEE
ncbi:acyl-CoA/acyl-ACP dehydrogenase [Aeoliella sp. ICT_H6.2]|uniref:Acyl-CoA/acyl-ACP dehydrogenase n=1 Tax=Aeoliella straminimaris TaxID=2954799 RepID=A0A9X2JH87_9BACT|nr:acyl-CoA dehydrogenase family protein [Aeoliella straminimaris]MCO6045207.1 acyl-CoA/acyl-ACP dehydrogenase [Aeoliella straminimaris]